MKKTPLHFAVAAAAVTLAPASHAVINAGFDDHTDIGTTYDSTNNTGQDTAVDQYGGQAGDGWTSPWQTWVGTSANYTREKAVLNSDPLQAGGGNYLQISSASTSTSSPRWAVYRELDSFGSVDLTKPTTVSFQYRMDDDDFYRGGGASLFNIRGGGYWGWNTDDATWGIGSVYINSTTRNWGVGQANTNTGLEIVEGNTFAFDINADPTTNSYTVSITNLDTNDSYTSELLTFYEDQSGDDVNEDPLGGTIGKSIWFIQQVTAENIGTAEVPIIDQTTFAASIDGISIVPEPSAFAFIAGSLALASMVFRRRR